MVVFFFVATIDLNVFPDLLSMEYTIICALRK